MKDAIDMSDGAIQTEIGNRLSRIRLQRNLSQEQLAREAGISKRTLVRLESGESIQLTSFIRVLRALGLIGGLETLIPPPLSSPLEQLRAHAKERRRASPGTKKESPTRKWTWGDDAPRKGGEA